MLLPPHTFPMLHCGSSLCTAVLQDKSAPAWTLLSFSLGNVHLLWREVLQGLQGNNLIHHDLLNGLQRNLCSSTWSNSSLSFFTDLVLFLTLFFLFFFFYFLTSLCGILLFLKYVFPEMPRESSMGSVVGPFEMAGTSYIQYRTALASPHSDQNLTIYIQYRSMQHIVNF